jgi:hypothetical protein
MKHVVSILLVFIAFSYGCTRKASNEKIQPGSLVADTIICDVVIHNPNPEDQWTTECLKNLKHRALIDSLFALVYDGKMKAYDFFSKEVIKNKDLKQMESENGFSRDHIGKIQFTERWYFDKKSQQFQKEVLSLVLGYELFNQDGSLRGYKPIFKIYLKH